MRTHAAARCPPTRCDSRFMRVRSETFQCRFDMLLKWDEKLGASKHVKSAPLTFDPIIRFPQSKEWRCLDDLGVALDRDSRGRVGERRTIEGVFTSSYEMQAFPFDAQAFDIVMHLGRDRESGIDCNFRNGYRLMQDDELNMIAQQVSDQYSFRPCRYNLTHTTHLESPQARSEFMLSIVVQRQVCACALRPRACAHVLALLRCYVALGSRNPRPIPAPPVRVALRVCPRSTDFS
jgi:hypothetical protein